MSQVNNITIVQLMRDFRMCVCCIVAVFSNGKKNTNPIQKNELNQFQLNLFLQLVLKSKFKEFINNIVSFEAIHS